MQDVDEAEQHQLSQALAENTMPSQIHFQDAQMTA